VEIKWEQGRKGQHGPSCQTALAAVQNDTTMEVSCRTSGSISNSDTGCRINQYAHVILATIQERNMAPHAIWHDHAGHVTS